MADLGAQHGKCRSRRNLGRVRHKLANLLANIGQCWSVLGRSWATGATVRQVVDKPSTNGQLRNSPGLPKVPVRDLGRATFRQRHCKVSLSFCHNRSRLVGHRLPSPRPQGNNLWEPIRRHTMTALASTGAPGEPTAPHAQGEPRAVPPDDRMLPADPETRAGRWKFGEYSWSESIAFTICVEFPWLTNSLMSNLCRPSVQSAESTPK